VILGVNNQREEKSHMHTTTVGVDLAKYVFFVCVMDAHGHVLQRLQFKRDAFAAWLAQLPSGTVVAMEACSSAHHWARRCLELGLQPRLIAAQFVIPFRKSRRAKNDRNDAEAIATAVRQGNMRFVVIKSVEQQARLSWHRVHEGHKKEKLAVTNRLRGLLAEFGLVVSRSDGALRRALVQFLERTDLVSEFMELIRLQYEHWQQIQQRLHRCEKRIESHARNDERCVRIRHLTGVGALTADAYVASLGNGQDFRNGRHVSAWLGVVPKQHSTGGKSVLGEITCAGDSYLRTLLIQGARTSVRIAHRVATDMATPEQLWIRQLAARLPFGKLLVAVANKHARQIWAMLARGEAYDPHAGAHHAMAA
jgi:transposase